MKLMPEQPTGKMIEAVRKAIENDYSTEALILDLYAAAPNIEHEEIAKLKREKEMLVEALNEVSRFIEELPVPTRSASFVLIKIEQALEKVKGKV